MDEGVNKTALTTQEVADILKIARNTVYELIKRGEITSYKVGRKVRFTMRDVEDYINRSRVSPFIRPPDDAGPSGPAPPADTAPFIICGQDVMLDVLSNYLGRHPGGRPVLRAYIGSYNGLSALYRGEVQVATAHLWDGDTGDYNTPYVRRLLPGVPTVVIGLTRRVQGLYVARGNPLNISAWSDFTRPGLRMINREKGAGSRVLLDEHLRLLGFFGRRIIGYFNEAQSHHAVASAVGRGEADVAVGHQKAAEQVEEVDFIPLQKERYDLVIKKEDLDQPIIRALLDMVRSEKFKNEFKPMGGYDLTDIGRILAET
ncbi:helix-turn-helix transcriptional regulator [Deltaproteobacteria bacterium OttesenSCG-928-M10]|nr:helix-turn-helix transcriptional regulator [Deltaproteobacteria bacterium OttesenSCG-928-M10]